MPPAQRQRASDGAWSPWCRSRRTSSAYTPSRFSCQQVRPGLPATPRHRPSRSAPWLSSASASESASCPRRSSSNLTTRSAFTSACKGFRAAPARNPVAALVCAMTVTPADVGMLAARMGKWPDSRADVLDSLGIDDVPGGLRALARLDQRVWDCVQWRPGGPEAGGMRMIVAELSARLAGRGHGGRRPGRRFGAGRPAAGVALGKPVQDGGRLGDAAAMGQRLELAGLPGFEVSGVLVDIDPGAQASRVQFGMELRGVDRKSVV